MKTNPIDSYTTQFSELSKQAISAVSPQLSQNFPWPRDSLIHSSEKNPYYIPGLAEFLKEQARSNFERKSSKSKKLSKKYFLGINSVKKQAQPMNLSLIMTRALSKPTIALAEEAMARSHLDLLEKRVDLLNKKGKKDGKCMIPGYKLKNSHVKSSHYRQNQSFSNRRSAELKDQQLALMGIRGGTEKLAEGFSGISNELGDFRFDADINMNADVKNLPKELLDLQLEKSLPPSRDPKKFSIIEGIRE